MALTDDAVLEAAETIRAGGTVVYPTETAYALGADPLNADAVKRVFMLKGRDEHKPLGLIASSLEQVEALCTMNSVERNLAARWPGALSLVLHLRPQHERVREALEHVTAGTGTVSIRISSHPSARRLAELLGHPVIATSANRSGNGECFSCQAVADQFPVAADLEMAIDGGAITPGKPSTVVVVRNGTPVILRPGAVDLQEGKPHNQ